MISDISSKIREAAPKIRAEIDKANSILLHCHPSPDPDSVCSALAMKFALEGLGKKATVIRGDSLIPDSFSHFSGAGDIVPKNFSEIDVGEFDLFLILDTASPEQISRYKPVSFPLPFMSVVIDHHRTNPGFADINLIEASYPATSQILFDLFELWQIKLTREIAINLFMGIYTDTGGFKYEGTGSRIFESAAVLSRSAPDFPKVIDRMDNSKKPSDIKFMGLALSAVKTFLDGKLALSMLSYDEISKNGLIPGDVRASEVSSTLRAVPEWHIVGSLFESEPGKIKMSFRTGDADKYDVSKLAAELGGGGHKGAAGAVLLSSLEEAKEKVLAKAKELYKL